MSRTLACAPLKLMPGGRETGKQTHAAWRDAHSGRASLAKGQLTQRGNNPGSSYGENSKLRPPRGKGGIGGFSQREHHHESECALKSGVLCD